MSHSHIKAVIKIIIYIYMYVHLCFEKYKLRTSSLVVNILVHVLYAINSRQNGRFFADEDFKCILLNENVRFLINFHWNMFLMA